jgi:hypothetical protein
MSLSRWPPPRSWRPLAARTRSGPRLGCAPLRVHGAGRRRRRAAVAGRGPGLGARPAEVEADACPDCGQPWSEATDPDNEFAYTAHLVRSATPARRPRRRVRPTRTRNGETSDGLHVHVQKIAHDGGELWPPVPSPSGCARTSAVHARHAAGRRSTSQLAGRRRGRRHGHDHRVRHRRRVGGQVRQGPVQRAGRHRGVIGRRWPSCAPPPWRRARPPATRPPRPPTPRRSSRARA